MYPERYPDSDPPRTISFILVSSGFGTRLRYSCFILTAFIEHCIDSIRQALFCSADMTEVHVLWYPEAQRYAPDFNAVYTCRNVDWLLNWSLARGAPAAVGQEHGVEHIMKRHQ